MQCDAFSCVSQRMIDKRQKERACFSLRLSNVPFRGAYEIGLKPMFLGREPKNITYGIMTYKNNNSICQIDI